MLKLGHSTDDRITRPHGLRETVRRGVGLATRELGGAWSRLEGEMLGYPQDCDGRNPWGEVSYTG